MVSHKTDAVYARMDLRAIALFVDVAQRGGFAPVARARDLDPSTVSRVVAGLERDLGVRLFQRTTRRLALTEAGATYLRHVEALLTEFERAGEAARAERTAPRGSLRLTTSVAFGHVCLVPLLGRFREAYPEVDLELLLTDAMLDLVSERIDLAIRLGPALAGDLVATKLRDTRYRICASPAYLSRAGRPRRAADLAAHRCLVFALPAFRRSWLVRDRKGRLEEIPVQPGIVISNALALREAAREGLGPALLADWLVDDDLASGRLVELFPDHLVTATSFATAAWLAYPSRTFLPARVRVAIDFLRRHLGADGRPGSR